MALVDEMMRDFYEDEHDRAMYRRLGRAMRVKPDERCHNCRFQVDGQCGHWGGDAVEEDHWCEDFSRRIK